MSLEARPDFEREKVRLVVDGHEVAAMGTDLAKDFAQRLVEAADVVDSVRRESRERYGRYVDDVDVEVADA